MERLRQKVASSSSRVIQSIQQAASGTFTPTNNAGSGADPMQANLAARLMADDATAHLTREEKEHILQVQRKAEEFQRDTINQIRACRGAGLVGDQENQPPATPELSRAARGPAYFRPASRRGPSSSSAQQNSPAPSSNIFSRPGSSLYSSGATPTATGSNTGRGSSGAASRAASSCSATTTTTGGSIEIGTSGALGQCKICRKSLAADEKRHLCSVCQLFICDDCASYSTSEQNWTCSSCRRRATAIEAASREPGVLSSSMAARRMTIRANQNELRQVAAISAGPSTSGAAPIGGGGDSSMSSSSGCSSMSAGSQAAVLQRQSSDPRRRLADSARLASSCAPTTGAGLASQSQAAVSSESSVGGLKLMRSSLAGSNVSASQQTRAKQQFPAAEESASSLQSQSGPLKRMARNSSSSIGPSSSPRQTPSSLQQARRASVAVPDVPADPGQGQSRVAGSRNMGQRKQSTAFFTASSALSHTQLVRFVPPQRAYQQPLTLITRAPLSKVAGHQGDALQRHHSVSRTSLAGHQTAGHPTETSNQSRRSSNASSSNQADNHQLIPVPPDQMHLRRLSDQSNLVRRSSIADNFDCFTISRNRSYSNVDSMPVVYTTCAAPIYAQQAGSQTLQPGYSEEHLAQSQQFQQNFQQQNFVQQQQQQQQQHHQLGVADSYYLQQRRLSDQSEMAVRGQLDQYNNLQPQQEPQVMYRSQEYVQQQKLSSVVTPYSVKSASGKRRSDEDLHSDSSSELGGGPGESLGFELEGGEQSGELGANGRLHERLLDEQQRLERAQLAAHFAATQQGQMRQQQQHQQQQQVPAIPSVSVSEFRSSQLRLQQQRGQQTCNNADLGGDSANRTSGPRQDRLLGARQPSGVAYARRGSGGRILPKIPGEQSRSMLDLPAQSPDQNTNTAATLDLPATSPTMRRASAPEGQNIKIVVDDMDQTGHSAYLNGYTQDYRGHQQNASYDLSSEQQLFYRKQQQLHYEQQLVGGQSEQVAGFPFDQRQQHQQYPFYQRLVLYRDDSIDPDSQMSGGFGLHVTGGKIDAESESSDAHLHAFVTWVLPCGPADQVGIRPGDRIVEWDGKCLIDMTYEQVAEVIDSSANAAELLVRPANRPQLAPSNQTFNNNSPSRQAARRLSHQTEHFRREQIHSHQGREEVGPNDFRFNKTPQNRTGTGRRLPQIPGAQYGDQQHQQQQSQQQQYGLLSHPNFDPQFVRNSSSSTGQLDQTSSGHSTSGALYHMQQHQNQQKFGQYQYLFAGHQQQQQSVSANDLYLHHHSSDHWSTSHTSSPQAGRTQVAVNGLEVGPSSAAYHLSGQRASLASSGPIDVSQVANNIEATQQQAADNGLIGLQVGVDEHNDQLEVSILSAVNVERDMNSNYVVKVKILPESNRFKACQTQPSNDLNWRETFIFQNFPAKQAHRMALEIGIWRHEEVPRLTAHKAQPICESLIPLQSARERNIDFWSLKVPVGSGQARRKSLNDLLESAQVRASQIDPCRISSNQNLIGRLPNGRSNSRQSLGGVASSSRATPTGSEQAHLVGGARLRAQPMRRASDETAAGIRSSSSTRVSPAASRRSISVMNVGVGVGESMVGNLASGGHLSGRNSLSGSGRPGSQSNLATGSNRSSTPGACDSPSRRLLLGGSGSNSPAFSGTVLNQPSSATPTTGMTPQGRRSSLVGIKSMAGYKSQKSSQSDASASQDLPHTVSGTPPSLSRRTTQRDLTHQLQRRTSVVQPAGSCSSEGTAGGPSSRRGSSADRISSGMTTPSGPIQRKGSFAAKAFSRFKRTMSMSKAEEPPELAGSSQTPSNRASTNGSSFDSSGSEADAVAEDLGVKRRLAIQPAL